MSTGSSRPQINGRRWITSSSSSSSVSSDVKSAASSSSTFRVVTYNVLSDAFIGDDEYLYCPAQFRYISTWRHDAIVAEVRNMDAHIVCFQEVSDSHYRTRLRQSMQQLGYDGVLLQRQDDSGLATFWRRSAFDMVDQKHCILHHAAETHLQMAVDLSVAQRKMIRQAIDRREAVLLLRLRHQDTGNHVAIGNVHVTWSQLKYPALQALQVSMAVSELRQFVHHTSARLIITSSSSSSSTLDQGPAAATAQCSEIICGDFNSPPGSLPYQLLSDGLLDNDIVDSLRRNCKFTDEIEKQRVYGLCDSLPPAAFAMHIPLISSYKSVVGAEPAVTNCDDCGGLQAEKAVHHLCLDYVWFNAQSLDVTAVLETPSVEQITKHYALPSEDFPSDHIPLMTELRFRTQQQAHHEQQQ